MIYPLLEQSWLPEFRYFTIDEFASKIREKGTVAKSTSDEINKRYNEDRFDPIDGELVSVADKFSAFLEAYMTREIGLQTRHTEEALRLSGNMNGSTVKVAGIDLSDLYREMQGKMNDKVRVALGRGENNVYCIIETGITLIRNAH